MLLLLIGIDWRVTRTGGINWPSNGCYAGIIAINTGVCWYIGALQSHMPALLAVTVPTHASSVGGTVPTHDTPVGGDSPNTCQHCSRWESQHMPALLAVTVPTHASTVGGESPHMPCQHCWRWPSPHMPALLAVSPHTCQHCWRWQSKAIEYHY